MSAEALRFLASSHGTPLGHPQQPHGGTFLSPGQQQRAPDIAAGQGVPQSLPPMPPPPAHLLDHFRSLPPGLLPMGFYPPGFTNSTLALDMKNDPISNSLAHGQPILPPPFYYDPCFSSYPYRDRFGGHLDINGARRKNATRETTAALKAWLHEHRKNPYPNKGEKVMLALITNMTLTQVSTWFANARRRLKKENKMTWSPRNRSGDDDDDDEDDDRNEEPNQTGADSSERPLSNQSSFLLDMRGDADGSDCEANEKSTFSGPIITPCTTSGKSGEHSDSHHRHFTYSSSRSMERLTEKRRVGDDTSATSLCEHLPPTSPNKKPKIWSIADTVNLPKDSTDSPRTSDQSTDRPYVPTAVMSPQSTDAKNLPLMSSSVGPFNFTFPPFPQMAAMFPRAVHLAGLGQMLGAGGQSHVQPVPPFFGLSPAAMMMAPRPEIFYRNFLSPLHQAPMNLAGLMQFGSAVNPFNFYQPSTAGIGSACTTAEISKPTPAQQPAISSTSAVISPISPANTTHSSSPNQNMTAENRNQLK